MRELSDHVTDAGWAEHVSQRLTDREEQALARSIQRGSPFGDDAWTVQTVKQLDLESTIKPRGRPRKTENGSGTFFCPAITGGLTAPE
ncbi:hypothetical protein [uncultured Gimesia sp.]|uniref:hypothetical protein n=1 Tax=uncultured Gimesia sp. TaxID=1678688 RepID=UPI0030D9C943|tara:strand:+ start:29462 stop:29725 length:264 start_codon:yes stop_codon:yes gene_type:complete